MPRRVWRSICKNVLKPVTSQFHFCQTAFTRGKNDFINLSEEVRHALQNVQPVVALESTIITHGMPPPDNHDVALEVEDIIRENGAVPATVAVLDGSIHVGLTSDQFHQLVNHPHPYKVSRRDLPYVLSQQSTGGTTVSATMIAAQLAGIEVFATGGIGGVHRGAETSFDISADLTELGRTSVAVISAGVKSILDIEKTLEYLETQGVFVASYGSEKFPAFFTPDSGFKSPYMVKDAREAAHAIACNLSLGLESGMLFAVPVPAEAAPSGEVIERMIHQAVEEASEKGIKGKEVTPFILERVNTLTDGLSLKSNKSLIRNNAKVGAQIAVELSHIKKSQSLLTSKLGSNQEMLGKSFVPKRSYCHSATTLKSGRPVVVGGAVVDYALTVNVDDVQFNGGTYPGNICQSFGGVGRNVADGLARLECNPLLISVIGDDFQAETFRQYSSHMDLRGIKSVENSSTPSYYAILKNSGELLFGVGDMDLHSMVSQEHISNFEEDIINAPLVFVDGNIPAHSIEYVADLCHAHGVPVWFDPTDIRKANKPFTNTAKDRLSFISPNYNELRVIYETLAGEECPRPKQDTSKCNTDEILEETRELVLPLLQFVPTIFASLGQHGVMVGSSASVQKSTSESVLHYKAYGESQKPKQIVSVSGAGDCMTVATISCLMRGSDMDTAIKAGLLASQYSLQNVRAVPTMLKPELFTPEKIHAWARWNPTRLQPSPTKLGDSLIGQ